MIEFPVGGAMNALSLFLGFHYASLGVSLTQIGALLMLARLLDVLIDPAVGLLSDRTRNRFGRRKTWIVAGVPIFALAVATVRAAGRGHRVVLRLLAGVVLARLLDDQHSVLRMGRRTDARLPRAHPHHDVAHDFRHARRVRIPRDSGGSPTVLRCRRQPGEVLSMAAAIALDHGSGVGCTRRNDVPDRGVGGEAVPLLRGFAVMSRNGPFLRLLAAFTLVGLGPVLQGAMFPFFMQHVVGDTTSGPKILLIYFPTVICGVLWGALARRMDKHRAWMTGMPLMVCATASYMLVGHGDLVMVMIILAISGIGSGALCALPASMKADVVDLDAIESGEDRAGLFFAAWSLAVKFIAAVGQGLAFTTLAWIGFHAKGENGPDEIFGLRVFYSAGPMLLYLRR